MSLSGCALLEPYPGPAMKGAEYKPFTDARVNDPSLSDATVVRNARDYASAMTAAYWHAAGDHARAKTFGTLGLGAAGAAAGFEAAKGRSHGNDLIAGIVPVSAAAFAVGGLLISPQRQQVYLAGATATLCARDRTDGYMPPAELEPYLELDPKLRKGDATGLVTETVSVRSLLADFQQTRNTLTEARLAAKDQEIQLADAQAKARGARARRAASDSHQAAANRLTAITGMITTADSLIKDATDALAEADSAVDGLASYSGRRRKAGLGLGAEVDRIRAAVNEQVQRTEPDVQAIKTSLGGLLQPTPTSPPATPAKVQGLVEANADIATLRGGAALRQAALTLSAHAQLARRALLRLQASESADAQSANCAVANVTGLTVVAPSSPLTIGQGELDISVYTPGQAPAVQIDGDAAGITSEVISKDAAHNGFQVRLKAAAEASPGHAVLIVQAGGQQQIAPFEVVAAPAKPAAKPAAATPASPAAAAGA
ncbi:hypothetical protein, partial [Phenylobacterium aquaticum]|uniref:hypothetical protein n=1 Tax=Phenylobacterium aquaticum TaxID=1763816 RepID=UPI001F5C502B